LVETVESSEEDLKILRQILIIPQLSGFLLDILSNGDHSLSEPRVVEPMLELLKLLSNFKSFSVDLDHIEIVLNAHHISRELAHGLLLVIADIVLLQQFVFEVLKIKIDV
jgi:hypothetical protein